MFAQRHSTERIEPVTPAIKRRFVEARLQPQANSNVVPYIAGSIKRMSLLNFMVHARLEVTFSPRINFITGVNGSGKSSILQAIVLAFGGNAKDSKRGATNLAQFIRTGTTRAEVCLTIQNEGEDGFRPDFYGSEITFERTIWESGTSQFVIKSADGQVKFQGAEATKEREGILAHYFIDLSNPLVILQQEEAKIFFQGNSETKLFELYESGTIVGSLQNLNAAAMKEAKRLLEFCEECKTQLESYQTEKKKLEEEIVRLQSLDCSQELRELEADMLWGQVGFLQKKYEAESQKVDNIQEKIAVLTEKEKDLSSQIKHLEQEIREVEQTNSNVMVDLNKVRKTQADKNKDLARLGKERKAVSEKLEAINDNVKKLASNIQEAKNTIRSLRMRNAQYGGNGSGDDESLEERKRQLMSAIQAKEGDLANVEAEVEKITSATKDIKQEEAKISGNLVDLCKQERHLQQEENQIKAEQREMAKAAAKASKNRVEARLGASMLSLLNDLESSAMQFSQPPIGPLVRHIRLTLEATSDAKIAELIEIEFGRNFLSGFIVNNASDMKLLRQKFNKHKFTQNPPIFTSAFEGKRYNVQKFKAAYKSVLIDYLDIDNDEVFNLLVDKRDVVSTLILPENEAQDLVQDISRVPKNVKKILTPSFYSYYPPTDGFMKSYYLNRLRAAAIMQAATADKSNFDSSRFDGSLRRVAQDLQACQDEVATNREVLREMEKERKRLSEEEKTWSRKRLATEREIQNLRNLLEHEEDTCAAVEAQRKDLEARLVMEREEAVRLQRERTELTRQFEVEAKALDSISTKVKSLDDQLKSKDEAEMKLGTCRRSLIKVATDLKKRRIEAEKLVQQTEATKKTYDQALEIAEAKCGDKRREVTQTARELQALQNRLERQQLENKTASGASLPQLFADKTNLHIRIEEGGRKYEEELVRSHKAFEMVEVRRHRLLVVRNSLNRCMSRFFKGYLSENRLSGGLKIDPAERACKITVYPVAGSRAQEEGQVITLNSLSGGERSKTLVTLIMTFWDHVLTPFRCLDEWDVYLDDQARGSIEEILIKTAKGSTRQFIFISPQTSRTVSQNDAVVKVLEIQANK